MKALFIPLLLAGISVAVPNQSDGANQVKPPFSITISTETPTVKAGAEVSIKVRITNASNHDINASSAYYRGVDGGMDASYDEEVRDSKGNLAKRKQSSEPESEVPLTGSIRLRTLKPGESADAVTGVSQQYDMSRPGQYGIQLSRRISDNPKDGVVKSNKITVTVTP
jgi:hypothetical protein